VGAILRVALSVRNRPKPVALAAKRDGRSVLCACPHGCSQTPGWPEPNEAPRRCTARQLFETKCTESQVAGSAKLPAEMTACSSHDSFRNGARQHDCADCALPVVESQCNALDTSTSGPTAALSLKQRLILSIALNPAVDRCEPEVRGAVRKSVDEWLEFRGEERQRRIRAIMEVRTVQL